MQKPGETFIPFLAAKNLLPTPMQVFLLLLLLQIFFTLPSHTGWGTGIFLSSLPLSSLQAKPLYPSDQQLTSENSSLGPLQVREIASGLRYPWSLSWVPSKSIIGVLGSLEALLGNSEDGTGFFIVISERNGSLWLLWQGQLARLSGLPNDVVQRGQGGYLGLYYQHSERRLYLSYSQAAAGGNSTLALISFRLRYDESGFHTANLRREFQAQPTEAGTSQYGGTITSDGKWIYLSVGDRGNRQEAQNPRSHLGSIVRLSVVKHSPGVADTPATLHFPGSQPGSPLPYIYTIGHRNPQGLVFDTMRRILWSTEHGPQGGDELNRIEVGHNYGWPTITYGTEPDSSAPIGEGSTKTDLDQPLRYWVPSLTPVGLAVITARNSSSSFAQWQGNLLIPMLRGQKLLRIVPSPQETQERAATELIPKLNQQEEALFEGRFGGLRWVGQGPDEAIYLLTDSKNGRLLRISRE